MQRPRGMIVPERAAMLGVWGLGVLACVLGLAMPPGTHEGLAGRGIDVLHIVGTAALAVTLVLGPGIALRAGPRPRRLTLGFLPLPGLALLGGTALVAWALADRVSAWRICLLVLAPILAWMAVSVLRADPDPLLEPDERWALLVVGCVLGLAIARTVWSLGPPGELYGGSISRTLEVGGRSDSRIPFHVVQLVAHGTGPFSPLAGGYFTPFDFSSRGPLAGLASAPIVLAAGGRPPVDLPLQPWAPFDPQGFMAFRIAAMALASTALLSLWTLIGTLGGRRAARFGLLLAATTPFLVHEVWFTWPKLFAASFVLLAAVSLIRGHPLRAGLLAGTAYLVHPGTLLFVPVLGLIALWPLVGARLRRPQLRHALLVLAGAAVCLLAWRVINLDHYTQTGFLDYLTQAGYGEQPTVENWVLSRLESVRNTLVPLTAFFFTDDLDWGVIRGVSPNVVYFFMQYWVGLPFGIAIVFFPLLLISLWRAARLWPWAVFLTIVVPFLGFAVYWPFREGLLREGLHGWVLALIAVVALQQREDGFPWLRSAPVRVVLGLRAVEVLALALVPTVGTLHLFLNPQYESTDALAVAAIFAFSGALGVLVLRESPRPAALVAPLSAPRWVGLAVAGAMGLAASLFILYTNRGTTFLLDDWAYLVQRAPELTDVTLFASQNGNWTTTNVLVYRALADLFGLGSYVPWRLTSLAIHLGGCALVYVLARRRIGATWALIPLALVLVSRGWETLLWPFQIGQLASILTGLAALALLDRRDLRGDLAASALLVVSVASSSFGPPFVFIVAVQLLLSRWRSLWVVVASAAAQAWWHFEYNDVLPPQGATNFEGIKAALRLGWEVMPGAPAAALGTSFSLGRALLLLLVALAIARIVLERRVPARLVALLAGFAGYWCLVAWARSEIPDLGRQARYVHLGVVLFVLAAVELFADVQIERWPARARAWAGGLRQVNPALPVAAFVLVALIAARGVVLSADEMRKGSAVTWRLWGERMLAQEAAYGVGRPALSGETPFYIEASAGFALALPLASVEATVERFGGPIYTGEESLLGRSADARSYADWALSRAQGAIVLEPPPAAPEAVGSEPARVLLDRTGVTSRGGCLHWALGAPVQRRVVVPAAGLRVRNTARAGPLGLALLRWSDTALGAETIVQPGQSAVVRPRPDSSPRPWRLEVHGSAATVCSLGTATK